MEYNPYTHIGTTLAGADVCLSADERREMMVVLGQSGVGKSTLLEGIASDDIARGDGLLLLDPHGPLAEAVIARVPAWRHNHVCHLDLTDLSNPVGLNVVEDVHPDARAVLADGVVSAMRSIWGTSWGPRMEQILRHATTALIELPMSSIVQLPRLLTDDEFRAAVAPRISDPITRSFFARFAGWRDTYRDEAIGPVLNKVEAFLAFPAVRNVLGQSKSTLHLDQAMARGRIVIVNLAKGSIGETAAHLFGALLLAALGSKMQTGGKRDFHIIADEAQHFGGVLAPLMREGRKFGVSVTAATQHLTALDEPTRSAFLGTARTLVCFRLGIEDAELLAPAFDREHQRFNSYTLQHFARGEAAVRSGSNDGVLVKVPPLEPASGNAAAAKAQSRRHYGRRREVVERHILRQLE
jgi:hypothetical protein